MFRIEKYRRLNENIFEMEVFAPRVAAKCMAGQFVIVRVDEKGERIPLTICDFDRDRKTVTVVVQEIGATTLKMGKLREGQYLADFVGPLGMPSELTTISAENLKKTNILFIAGGVGVAPVYPQLKFLKENGVLADVIVGAKSKDLMILQDELKLVANNVYVTTDDGSYGDKGLVTDKLKSLTDSGKTYDLCITIGPVIMMKFVCLLTQKLGIRTIVSINPIMVDGTGMCGACRLTVGNKVKFACVDGPEFDGHKVDFDGVMNRLKLYATEEGRALLKEREGNTHHGGCGMCGDD